MKDILRMSIIFFGLVWYFLIANNPAWYWLFIILFAGIVISEILTPPKRKAKTRKTTKTNKNQANARKSHTSPKRKRSDRELLTAPLSDLDGYEFERLVALYYQDKGYKPQIIGGAGDHEVDIILTDPKEHYNIAVQCKHWKTKNVGNDIILRLSAGKRVHKCIDAWCITTSNYTKSAKEAVEELNIRLFNGLHVQDKIGDWKKEKLEKNQNTRLF